METIQVKVNRELAEQYAMLHGRTFSTTAPNLGAFIAAFVSDRLVEEINFLERESTQTAQ